MPGTVGLVGQLIGTQKLLTAAERLRGKSRSSPAKASSNDLYVTASLDLRPRSASPVETDVRRGETQSHAPPKSLLVAWKRWPDHDVGASPAHHRELQQLASASRLPLSPPGCFPSDAARGQTEEASDENHPAPFRAAYQPEWAVEMLRFLGSELSLDVDEVFEECDGPRLFAGHDLSGQPWLVAETSRTAVEATWICARHSPRALACVRGGRAEVKDALRHSIDGTVVVVRLVSTTMVADRLLLCAELGNDLLPDIHWCVGRPRSESGLSIATAAGASP